MKKDIDFNFLTNTWYKNKIPLTFQQYKYTCTYLCSLLK